MYAITFYARKFIGIIPHPRLRAFIIKLYGSDIGKNVVLEDIPIGTMPFGWMYPNLKIGDNTALVQDTKLDLTDKISIGKNCAKGWCFNIYAPGSWRFSTKNMFKRYL